LTENIGGGEAVVDRVAKHGGANPSLLIQEKIIMPAAGNRRITFSEWPVRAVRGSYDTIVAYLILLGSGEIAVLAILP